MADFNNEIIDGQSTVADNLGKTNRNFMLLKNILKTLTSSSDLSSTLNSMMTNISKTYVKTEHIIDNLVSTATNKPVSARQAKLLKDELTQLNQNITSLMDQTAQTISVPFINGWMNETYLEPVRLWKIGNTAFISGIAKGGIRTRGTGMFYLPEGYRPLKNTAAGVSSLFSNSVYRIDFGSDGNVIIQSDNVADYLTFTGIHWRVD